MKLFKSIYREETDCRIRAQEHPCKTDELRSCKHAVDGCWQQLHLRHPDESLAQTCPRVVSVRDVIQELHTGWVVERTVITVIKYNKPEV